MVKKTIIVTLHLKVLYENNYFYLCFVFSVNSYMYNGSTLFESIPM